MTTEQNHYLTAARLMRSNRFMSLGTYGKDGACVSPLAFTVEPDFTLLFQSDSQSQHSVNLRTNPAVAGAIFDSNSTLEHADSIQFSGTVVPVAAEDVPDVVDRFYRFSYPDDQNRIRWMRPAADFAGAAAQRFYRITMKTAFKLDLESTMPDRRLTLDVGLLQEAYFVEEAS